MLSLIFEMKILKHTFKIPKLEVINDELVESGVCEETYTFTLLHKGVGLFEDIAKKPLLAYLYEIDIEDKEAIAKILSKDFIPNLACASYVKIENNQFHNNRATAEDFKKLPVYQKVTEDIDFAVELIQMAMDCMIDIQKQENATKANVNSKKV